MKFDSASVQALLFHRNNVVAVASALPGGSELYNLKSDPKQDKNVISQHPDIARELHQLFVKFMRETNVPQRLMEPRLELRL